ncbi:DNA/RNA non-specific endonuclease [Mycobacteroides abscessus subsp. abscessus]|uniref:DNA/RNA non-specific endonuclease n=1 Tax=Mycobacteroides abscessus TaxID=36809 RepID=UPI00266C2ECC|nr:DNA/RNA non-specific endonuclease [Mycobacteroides abscessus]MDO3003928.1 DNA/RNA non-specific endonuclease [Mycobacteroides abscessus subsp. abscessus]MDO3196607.1 DNA/RNA non-specific endonuclease [Mycobacteroides abscessus subsp. abscessus]MDO3278288.1 DNA/RNA non-specific endonuclease [Mycobacteroides abscessus subsp. abscessus]
MSAVNRDVTEAASVLACRDLTHSSEPQAAPVPEAPSTGDTARRVAAVFAGAVLVVAAVTGLHGLYRAGGDVVAWSVWVVELLAGMTALGGGIKLIAWGIKPAITAVSVAGKHRLAEPVQAVIAAVAVIAGALGMWWTLRGGYAEWWQHLSGETSWTLLLGIGQMLMAVLAGAALFTGGKYLTGLATEVLTDAGMLGARDRTPGSEGAGAHRNQSRTDRDESVWHPGLVAALIGGGLGLVLLTAGITPRLYVWITGPDVLPAVAAIVAVLVWGVGANLGWWKGLAGLWQWATDASHKAAATSGVVALLMFSAGGLGLGWFTPATVPQAHAQCPPDCGGGSNGSGSYGPDASQFQPPQMPGQMPDYQGGINQPALDQNSSISIYNTQAPSVSNNGSQGSSGQQGPQQSWDQPAHGTQIPDYQNAAPYTQGPGRPNPDFNPGSDAGSQGGQPNQGAQQPVQQPQQASQQPTQQDAGQQPNQSPDQSSDQQKIDDLTRQLQEKQQQSSQDRQRIDDLTKQLQQQNKQNQKQQQSPRFPSKDDKKDRDQQDRDNQSGDNDLSALLLGAASTRRRKQDEQGSSDQQRPQGPDTQALAQDGAQLGQSLPGDIANTVSDSVNLGQSAGSAAQNFGSAAQAGASLASGAQSGAVNPIDAVALVQGVSGGISDTADAVGSGASIASSWLNEAGQGAQLAADANPQLKAEAEQVRQLTQAGGQVADLTGKVAGGVSQVSGMVNTASSLGTSGMPDTSGATDALSGTATAVNGPGDVPKPTPPTPSQPSSASQLLGNMVGGPQQPTQPTAPGNPNAGSLQGILQPPPSADAVQKQLDLVNQAQDRVKQAQSVVDQSAAQVYMSPQNAPGPDDVKRQGQALFDARRELTDQTLALTEMNQRLIDNGQPPIQIPLLPDNVSRQAFPPEPSKAQEFSGAWSEFSKSTYGIVPDIPTDIRTATNFDQASGADKAALALDGMAIVPGLGAIGRGLKGIEGIRGGEAAIRAADDIPLPSKPVGTSVVTDVTKQGGQAVYQGVDNLGRPTGVTARITPDMIRTGSDAMRAPTPPGFGGQAAGHARGHLLANVLGGSGKLSENLVTLINNPVNSPVMRGFEMSVAKAVEGGQIIDYAVTPLYRGAEAMPEAVQIIAKGNGGFDLAVTILNR